MFRRIATNPLLTCIAISRHPDYSEFLSLSLTHTHTYKLTMTEKYESSPDLESQHIDGTPLTRTNTAITLSNEQYERLFFQPSAPRAGDAAKRFGKNHSSLKDVTI